MTDTPNPPEGWYPDPAGSGGLRRWNGTGWTDEVRPSAAPAPDSAREPQPEEPAAAPTSHPATVSADSAVPATESVTPAHDASPAAGASPVAEVPSADRAAPAADASLAESTAPDATIPPAAAAPGTVDAVSAGGTASDDAGRGTDAAGTAESAAGAAESVAAPADPRRDTTADWDVDAAQRPPAVPPVPPAPVGAPAYSSGPAAPVPPAGTTPGYAAASRPAPAAPAYAAYPGAPAAAAAPVRRDVPTDTVWIWLVVALPLLGVLSLFLFDWRSYVDASIYGSLYPEAGPMVLGSTVGVTVGASVISILIAGLSVLFAFLDWRALRARGIERPFHWAWSLFVFVITSGVYVIGRGVILRRQTGKGLGPVWAWIAVSVVSIIIVTVWGLLLLAHLFEVLEQLGLVY